MTSVNGVPAFAAVGTPVIQRVVNEPRTSNERLFAVTPAAVSVIASACSSAAMTAVVVLTPETKSCGAVGVSVPSRLFHCAGLLKPVTRLPAESRARATTEKDWPVFARDGTDRTMWSSAPTRLKGLLAADASAVLTVSTSPATGAVLASVVRLRPLTKAAGGVAANTPALSLHAGTPA